MPITYLLDKRFIAAVAFEGLSVVSFQRDYKNYSIPYLGLGEFSYISKEGKTKTYCLCEADLVFCMLIFNFMC